MTYSYLLCRGMILLFESLLNLLLSHLWNSLYHKWNEIKKVTSNWHLVAISFENYNDYVKPKRQAENNKLQIGF